jgi:hypothetical protein
MGPDPATADPEPTDTLPVPGGDSGSTPDGTTPDAVAADAGTETNLARRRFFRQFAG